MPDVTGHISEFVRRVVEDRMGGDDYAVVAILLGLVVAVLLFRHRKRAFAVCEAPTHSTAVARYQVGSMKRKWSHGKWIRVCPSCWERTRDENDDR